MIGARPSAAIAVSTLAAGFALLGCGEKGEPATTGKVVPQTTVTESTGATTTTQQGQTDEQLVQAAATDYLTLPGADVCANVITPKLLKSAYGGRAACVAARKTKRLAKNVDLKRVDLGDQRAAVDAVAKGGVYGSGTKVTLNLVLESKGVWLVNTARPNSPAP